MATQIPTGTAGQLHTVPAVASDTFAMIAATQTLTNKTLTSPVITGGTSTVQRPIAAQTTEGAITLGHKIVVLTHADAGAYTLAAPTADTHDGMVMTFTAGTAAAHVITATDLIHDGVTGGAKDTATFAAYLGASLTLVAYQGYWYVLSKNLCTIAAV
jgi:hypothetical protein